MSLLESRGIHDVQVKQSRQKLESLFLDIVHQAQSEGVSTAGAGNAGAVAAFLTRPGEAGGAGGVVVDAGGRGGTGRGP